VTFGLTLLFDWYLSVCPTHGDMELNKRYVDSEIRLEEMGARI
jgi:hypothetical protein